MPLPLSSFFDELQKLGTLSPEHAEKSLQELEGAVNTLNKLEEQKPSAGQLGRYALVGGTLSPAINAVSDAVKGTLKRPTARGLAGDVLKGGLVASAIPIARHELDRRAALHTARSRMAELTR